MRLEGGRRKLISEVKPGDRILTRDYSSNKLVYSEVLTFLDRDVNATRAFLRFHMANNKTVTTTPAHLLLLNTGNQIFAANVQLGDILQVPNEERGVTEGSKVIRIEDVLEKGVYAPLTTSGTLVVDGVVASCYAAIDSQKLAHMSLAPLRAWLWLMPKANLINGIHPYAKVLHSIAKYILPKSMLYE